MKDYMITFALPKGRLLPLVTGLLRDAGLFRVDMEKDGRKLIYQDEENNVRYLICRAADVPTFVEYGAADLGVAGKDVILEQLCLQHGKNRTWFPDGRPHPVVPP